MPYLKRRAALGSLEIRPDIRGQLGSALSDVEIVPNSPSTLGSAVSSIETAIGDSFLIVADVIASGLDFDSLSSLAYVEINAELKINGVVVDIKDFDWSKPTGRIGSIFNCRLANPYYAASIRDSIDFSIVVKVGGTDKHIKLIENGKLTAISPTTSFRGGKGGGPTDELTISAVDVIADKFTLAPRTPVIMYDPFRVKSDTIDTNPNDAIRRKDGSAILPIVEPVYGLTMKQIIKRAYTNRGGAYFMSPIAGPLVSSAWKTYSNGGGSSNQIGVGFDDVITNIKDYPVRMARFDLESGWHQGASPCVTMYHPIYSVYNNILYISDPLKPLPYAYTPLIITLDEHKQLSQAQPFKPDLTSVLLTYQYYDNDPSESGALLSVDKYEDLDPVSSGDGSTLYTRNWYRDFFPAGEPENVLEHRLIRTESKTEQIITWTIIEGIDADGSVVEQEYTNGPYVTATEDINYQYTNDLKTGYTRNVSCALNSLGYSGATPVTLVPVLTEDNVTNWTDDPATPGNKVQSMSVTSVRSKCAKVDTGRLLEIDGEFVSIYEYVPILDAQRSPGLIDDETILTDFMDIKSVYERLRHVKGKQYDVQRITVDQLSNTASVSSVSPTTSGQRGPNVDQYAVKSRTVLFEDADAIAAVGPRIPVGINSYELPKDRAFAWAEQELKLQIKPLKTPPIDLPTPNFSIDQGSVIRAQTRDGYTADLIVTGLSIRGTQLGRQGHRISESLETLELLPAS